jgi:predicted acyltransferase
MDTLTAPQPTALKTSTAGSRFLALDIFRGLTIAGMVLVNTPGSWEYVYAPLRHASWNGCTPTDLVFPFFLFAVGNALAFSMPKYEALGNAEVLKKIFTRTALIFGVGLLLHWYPFVTWSEGELVFKSPENLRIMGVLQRIALAYLGAALIVHFFKPAKAFIAAAVILFAYWAILLAFGDLTLEGNAVLKLDRSLLGENHMYKGYHSEVLQRNVAFDPEGLLSTIPAVASVIFGFLAGRFLCTRGNSYETISWLFMSGLSFIFLGLCWDLVFPINKPIWSSSYVLYTTGLATVILSMIIFITDLKEQKSWSRPFVLFGRNPLLLYILSGVIVKTYFLILINDTNAYGALYQYVFQPLGGNYFGSLLFALFHVLLLLVIAWWLDRRKIYFRV